MRMSQPGPRGQVNAAPWRRWLLPTAVTAGILTLLALSRGAPRGMALSYTRFTADVTAGTVRAVTIGPAGQVTGRLAGGQPFTTTIPVGLGGNGLTGQLAAHHVSFAEHHPLAAQRGYSEHTQWLIDQEVSALLTSAEARARELLTSDKQALTQLTTALLDQETITGDQVRALVQATPPPGELPISTIRVSR